MRKNVIAYAPLPESLRAELSQSYTLIEFAQPNGDDRERFLQALSGAHALLGSAVKVNAELLEKAPQLEVVSSVSAGVDNYDMDALTARGILLTNTPSAVTESTADTAFTLVLATARRAVEMATLIRDGKWTRSIASEHFGVDVHGKKLGIVGLGRIGTAIARRGHLGFGMEILYQANSRKPEQEKSLGARFCELPELLAEADFVVLTVPLSDQTRGLIGKEQLALMKSSAILVNIARGQVIDEAALIDALQSGRIRGAGLDVFEKEPLPNSSPLANMPNVVALPHIGSATQQTRDRMATDAARNMVSALEGQRPEDLVNPAALDKR